ncbi:MAG: DUF1573 domain-containing protein [Sphingobacteriales bacterium JAD_PAG50586_3]|nr:MAG: DUF1573 domain-containing protein [Sphingobacteriales bacterium JAD_PAG50586_3]
MKKIMPIIALLLYTLNSFAQAPVKAPALSNDKMPEITFEHDMHDFGTVSYGTPAVHEFTFNNSGRAPLLISDVKAQCTCITVEWPKGAIEPGKSGSIIVTYDTKKVGMVVKKLTVTSNNRKAVMDIAVKIHVLNDAKPVAPSDSVTTAPLPPGE